MMQMLLALMDEAYTGSTIEDSRGNSGSDDSSPLDLADPMFLDLLKDENDGIAVSSFSYTIEYVQCFHIPPEFLVLVVSFSTVSFRQNIGYPLQYLQHYKQQLTAHNRTDQNSHWKWHLAFFLCILQLHCGTLTNVCCLPFFSL